MLASFCHTSRKSYIMKQSPRAPALSQNEQLCDLLILHHMQRVRSVDNSQSHYSGRDTLKTTGLKWKKAQYCSFNFTTLQKKKKKIFRMKNQKHHARIDRQ